jgi:hypothetical protein
METNMQQTMEISLRGELIEGEDLIWSDNPNPHNKSINSPVRGLLITTIIIAIISIVLIGIGIILQKFVADQTAGPALYGFGGMCAFLAFLFAIAVFTERGKTHTTHNTLYAITNRRVIIVHIGNNGNTTTYSFGKNDIGQVQRMERPDGSGDLTFASRIVSRNEMFIGIDNIRRVEHILISTLK